MAGPGNDAEPTAPPWVDVGLLAQYLSNAKGYAGYFTGAEKSIEEFCVVDQWACAYYGEANVPFSFLRPRPPGEDPPDCEAFDFKGNRWGFEVTELVDEKLRKCGQLHPSHPNFEVSIEDRDYTEAEFVAAIAARLMKKNKPAEAWKGSPYWRLILIICCDENLSRHDVKSWLANASFVKPSMIDEAFLLLPPQPLIDDGLSADENGIVFPLLLA